MVLTPPAVVRRAALCRTAIVLLGLGQFYVLGVRSLHSHAEVVRRIEVPRPNLKNGAPQKVFMPDDVKALLSECCTGKGPDDFLFTWKGTAKCSIFGKRGQT